MADKEKRIKRNNKHIANYKRLEEKFKARRQELEAENEELENG